MRRAKGLNGAGAALVLAGTTGVLIGSTGARADGTATWLWNVVTNDGDKIVEPGESAFVQLSLLTTPDPDTDFIGLAAAIFDTVGGANASKGSIVTWEVLNDLDYLTGDLTTTDGVSLYNTNVGQLSVYGPFFTDNPLEVLTFQWKPDQLGAYTVNYDTLTHHMVMWEGEDGDDAHDVAWNTIEAGISFQVVPAPGGAAVIGATAVAFMRRRRS